MGKQIINHKEKLDKVLYEKDFYTESNGKEYPKSRVRVGYYTYSGERLDKNGEYVPYNGDKIVISTSKIKSNDGIIEVEKKILYNKDGVGYVVDDKKDIILTVEEYSDLLENVDTLN